MSVFTQIADLSRTIEAGYPDAATELARETRNLQWVRDSPELQDRLATVHHNYQSWRDVCADYRHALAELGDLVFRHLPDLAAELRIVSDTVGHFQGELDVDQLIGELRRIRAAAAGQVAAGDQGQPVEDRGGSGGKRGQARKTTPKKRRKRKQTPLTEIQQRTMEVVVECKGNYTKAAEKLQKHRSTVKQAFEAGCRILEKDPVEYGKGPSKKTFFRDKRGQEDIADIDSQFFDAGDGDDQDEFEAARREDLETQQRRHRKR